MKYEHFASDDGMHNHPLRPHIPWYVLSSNVANYLNIYQARKRIRKMKEWYKWRSLDARMNAEINRLPEALAQTKTLCLPPDESLLQVT